MSALRTGYCPLLPKSHVLSSQAPYMPVAPVGDRSSAVVLPSPPALAVSPEVAVSQ